jgi:hypothetical protein
LAGSASYCDQGAVALSYLKLRTYQNSALKSARTTMKFSATWSHFVAFSTRIQMYLSRVRHLFQHVMQKSFVRPGEAASYCVRLQAKLDLKLSLKNDCMRAN